VAEKRAEALLEMIFIGIFIKLFTLNRAVGVGWTSRV
jgi:hypothetical protein